MVASVVGSVVGGGVSGGVSGGLSGGSTWWVDVVNDVGFVGDDGVRECVNQRRPSHAQASCNQ